MKHRVRNIRRIRAKLSVGSARLLDGLRCRVVGPHPIARGWLKIRLVAPTAELERRGISEREWPIARDRLV